MTVNYESENKSVAPSPFHAKTKTENEKDEGKRVTLKNKSKQNAIKILKLEKYEIIKPYFLFNFQS